MQPSDANDNEGITSAKAALHTTMEQNDRFAQRLTELVTLINELALAATLDELYRQAVEFGRLRLGFERISLWLLAPDGGHVQGTFGTDEQGRQRDERGEIQPISAHRFVYSLITNPTRLLIEQEAALYDERGATVGRGERGVAALWNRKEVIGFLSVDNLLTGRPFQEQDWRVLELYASGVGHLISLKRTESALRANQEMFAQMLELLPVGVSVVDRQQRTTLRNRAVAEIWQLGDQEAGMEITRRGWWVANGQPVQPHEWAGIQVLQTGRPVLNQEIEIECADHSRRIILNSAVPLRDEQGEVASALIVNQDITARKQHERQHAATAALANALRTVTSRAATIQTVTSQVYELLGATGVCLLTPAEPLSRLKVECAEGDLSAVAGEQIVLSDGQRAAIFNAGSPLQLTRYEDEPSGLFFSLSRRTQRLLYAPLAVQDTTIGALVIGLDHAADAAQLRLLAILADNAAAAIHRAILYEELQTQAQRLQLVMDSADFAVLLLDRDHTVVLANSRGQKTLALLAGTQVGEKLLLLGDTPIEQLLLLASPVGCPATITHEERIYQSSAAPVLRDGELDGWVLVLHDVTRERQIQTSIRQHERLAAVGQLAAGIAHDFNNIVAVILLYVQMLQRANRLDESDRKRLDVIADQAKQASNLVRQILDFSRQTVLERQPTDMAALVEASIALWQRTLPENIEIRYTADEGQRFTVLADSAMLQQALTNLALNARDAMPGGGLLTIHLRWVEVAPGMEPPVPGLLPGRWVCVAMTDTGTGIAPEHLPRIFDPFFTTKEIGRGAGLGLAQVYGIVRQHEGQVHVQSALGYGATVEIYLPFEDAARVDARRETQEELNPGAGLILLVEDNPSAREATQAILEMSGYRVLAAANGREAIRLAREHRAELDLVLSDLVMPEMGGVELYHAVQRINPAIRVMIMTGYPLEHEGRILLEAGIVNWIQKPFSIKQLTERIGQLLGQALSGGESPLSSE
ncbi:MAG TPA: response regulator [Caldilineaceae bacterium]|nr:response regulator [Caldilineaceae bacterium]